MNVVPAGGFSKGTVGLLSRPVGRIHFAGTETARRWPGFVCLDAIGLNMSCSTTAHNNSISVVACRYMEGAVDAAVRVVEELLERFNVDNSSTTIARQSQCDSKWIWSWPPPSYEQSAFGIFGSLGCAVAIAILAWSIVSLS